jgi:hypothetical protein
MVTDGAAHRGTQTNDRVLRDDVARAGLKAEVARNWLRAMRAGDWEAAWRESDRVPSELVWNGTPFDGRRVLVRCLHGLGDTIEFMRFVPSVLERAAHVDFLVQPALLDLLRGAPGLGDVSNAWTDDPPPCDFEIEVMELAYALRVQAANVPAPYPHLAAQVRGRAPVPLHEDENLRVGLCWASSAWDTSRSVPLADFAQLVRSPGVTFYSLQQEDAARDPLVAELGIVPLSTHTQAIADAAAAMLQMDLVMSIDAMPAHLTATLGRRTWLLLKHDADWRWMDGRADTPWYPTMRLFRQPSPGDWRGTLDAVAQELRLVQAAARR